MTHLIDARRLVDEFAETDGSMPILVFAMLRLYFEHGPFPFDATRLAELLTEMNPRARVNGEQLAALQPELERFFQSTPQGWEPRDGVLHYRNAEPPLTERPRANSIAALKLSRIRASDPSG